MKLKILAFAFISILTFSAFGDQFITIGTGSVTGVYYPTGGAICRIVNKQRKISHIRCSVESTIGSVYNIKAVKTGEFDFGLSQSDIAYQAYNGLKEFKGKPIKDLRSVMAIYPELLTLVVRKDSGIRKLIDIKGKKINIDLPGSGTRATAQIVMKAVGLSDKDLAVASTMGLSEDPSLLKNHKIDGYFAVLGHPATNVKDAAKSSNIDIIPIDGPKINPLYKKYPYYARGVISGTFYKGVNHDTPSIGVKAVLVTTSKVSDKLVYTITKAILDNFDAFKKLQPAYKTITKKSLLEGLAIPQQKGAIKAFKEAGLLK